MVSGTSLEVTESETWRGKWQKIGGFIYNSTNRTMMGRSSAQWLQLILFYICFYSLLAVFFGVALHLFLSTLDTRLPKWTVSSSILGSTPGMGFRPKISENSTALLWVNGKTDTDYSTEQACIDGLSEFLKPYLDANQVSSHFMDCSGNATPVFSTNDEDPQVCRVKMNDLGPCGSDPSFGYSRKAPCVALKINKMIDWVPQPYTDLSQVPSNVTDFYANVLRKPFTLDSNAVYVTCGGLTAPDDEHMGPITLNPPVIRANYFPYTNAKGYLAPIVMVQFLNPQNGVVVNVKCSTWAQNLVPDDSTLLATVNFQLLVSSQWTTSF